MAPCYYATHGLPPPNPNSRTNLLQARLLATPTTKDLSDWHKSRLRLFQDVFQCLAQHRIPINYHFQCYNSAHGDNIPAFWYFFPTAAPLAIVPPPPGSVPSASANDVLGRQPPSILVCKKHSCQSIHVHRICDRGMCKKHCDIDSGCRVHLPPPPPPPQPLPPFTGPNLELLQALRNDAHAVPRAAHRLAQDALQNEHKRRAAVARIPTVTLSPPQLTPVKRHFVLVHWEHDNEPPTVYGIQNPSTWPLWSFTAATGLEICVSDSNCVSSFDYTNFVALALTVIVYLIKATGGAWLNEAAKTR
ncbi:hypothetical protein K438DRAFT_1985432 [Mycena galopus ATCC 62051]|nr:hypothetical protein K438DRAFT_1985432 [Mycena galopus ATCC 62051]